MKIRRGVAVILILAMMLELLPLAAMAAVAGTSDYCPLSGTSSHLFGGWNALKEATCAAKGEQIRSCRCGYSETKAIPKLDHSWGSWTVTRESTCSKEGERQHTCKVCGTTAKENIEKKEHTWDDWTVIKAATCTEKGRRQHVCKVCKEKETQTVKKLDHDWSEWEYIVEATDHSSGTRSHVCRNCGVSETVDYDPEGTLRRGDKGDAVTALNAELICYGVMKGRAGSTFNKNTEAAVKKVQQAEGQTADGVAWPQTQALLGHQFGEWEVVKEMTDFSTGVRQRVCSRCKYKEKVEDYPSPMYQRGDKGTGVKALQQALTKAGYKPGAADGNFGKKTQTAVKAFQKKNKLKQDGIAWPGVLKLLGMVSANGTLIGAGPHIEDGGDKKDDFSAAAVTTLSNTSAASAAAKVLTGSAADLGETGYSLRSLTVLSRPEDEDVYYTGAVIPIQMRLTVDEMDQYTWAGTECGSGDSYKQASWMDGRTVLKSGETYEFTYYMGLLPAHSGWKKRPVTVYLRSQSTGMMEKETAMVGPPFTYPTVSLVASSGDHTINDYDAYLYLNVSPSSHIGFAYAGEKMDIPYTVDSDGNTEISNVTLVCEQQVMGVTYATDKILLTKKMTAGDTFSGMARMYVSKPSSATGPYTLNMYLTGTYLNKKSNLENVVSLPVSRTFGIEDPTWKEGQLNLAAFIEPIKMAYSLNDLVRLEMKVTSTGTDTVENVQVRLAGAYQQEADVLGNPRSEEEWSMMIPGDTRTATWEHRITQEDVERGSFEVGFEAAGTARKTRDPVRSPRLSVIMATTTEPAEEVISLSAEVRQPQAEYMTDVPIPVKLTVSADTQSNVKKVWIYATEDNRKTTNITGWHDFGHGIKGNLCAEIPFKIPAGKTDTAKATVSIPVALRSKGTFRASFIAEAELENGTMVQSNVTTLLLPIVKEFGLMQVVIPNQEEYFAGSAVPVTVHIDYVGKHKPDKFKIQYRLTQKAGWKDAGTLEMKGNTGKIEFELPLNQEDFVNDEWTYMIAATPIRTGSLGIPIRTLSFKKAEEQNDLEEPNDSEDPNDLDVPVGPNGLKDLTLMPDVYEGTGAVKISGRIMNYPPDLSIGWQLGDKAELRVDAIHESEKSAAFMSLRQVEPDGTEAEIGHNEECESIGDEFAVKLDESHLMDGRFDYAYIAYATEDENDPEVSAGIASVVKHIYLPYNTPVIKAEQSESKAAGHEDGAEASGGEAEGKNGDAEDAEGNGEGGSKENGKKQKMIILPSDFPASQDGAEETNEMSDTENAVAESAEAAEGNESVITSTADTEGAENEETSKASITSTAKTSDSESAADTAASASSTGSAAAEPLEISSEDAIAGHFGYEGGSGSGSISTVSGYSFFSETPKTTAPLTEEPIPGIKAEDDFCAGALAGLMENLPEIEVIFCSAHAELPGAGLVPLEDLAEAEILWTEALNAEYEILLIVAETEEEKESIEADQRLFLALLEMERTGDNDAEILTRIMLRVAAMCEIRHQAEDPLAALQALTGATSLQ